MKMKWMILATLIPVLSHASDILAVKGLPDWAFTFQQKYNLPNSSAKLVDNYGNGYEDLYGTRNVRAVLSGILYRGGANNYYHKVEPRDNHNPLPDDGLENLCKE